MRVRRTGIKNRVLRWTRAISPHGRRISKEWRKEAKRAG